MLADWLQGLGPLLLVVFWVLRQVFSAKQEEEPAPPPRRPRPAPEGGKADAARRGPAEARAAGGENAQRAEVEEFLRKIGQLRDDQPEAPRAEAEPVEEPPRGRRPIDPFEEPPRRAAEPAVARGSSEIELLIDDRAEGAAPQEAEVQHGPVGALAEKHLAESQLAEQAAHLGERIASADERFESRLHDKFDHRLGRLEEKHPSGADAAKPTGAEASRQPAAKRVAEMLAKPGGFRDAIVMSEILRRPSDTL